MPRFTFSEAMTANQRGLDPVASWQYKRVPFTGRWAAGAVVQLLARSTATGTTMSVVTGSQTVQQESPVQAGGTAGTTPSVLNTSPVTWSAAPGDQLNILLNETAGSTPTVDGEIVIEPAV